MQPSPTALRAAHWPYQEPPIDVEYRVVSERAPGRCWKTLAVFAYVIGYAVLAALPWTAAALAIFMFFGQAWCWAFVLVSIAITSLRGLRD